MGFPVLDLCLLGCGRPIKPSPKEKERMAVNPNLILITQNRREIGLVEGKSGKANGEVFSYCRK
jgi:hypothetical protein